MGPSTQAVQGPVPRSLYPHLYLNRANAFPSGGPLLLLALTRVLYLRQPAMQRQQYALWSLCTIVTLAVFTVRLVRSRSRVKPASSASANLASHPPRYLGFIGPAALRLLVRTAQVRA